MLIRSNRTTGELAFHRCRTPQPFALHHSAAVAGRRWSIEEALRAAKTGLGLDQHQHRRWKAWHRWTTLVIDPARRVTDVITWSMYRRRHQDQAKISHYARQAIRGPEKISRWSARCRVTRPSNHQDGLRAGAYHASHNACTTTFHQSSDDRR